MVRPRIAVGVLALLAVVVVVLVPAAGAGAADLAASAWWNRAGGELPVSSPIGLPLEAPAATLVPVPEGGLYVANDASGPSGVTALRFTDVTLTSGVLTLQVDGSALAPAGAVVLACPVTSSWQVTTNGAWSERPGVDCTRAVARGEPNADMTLITWNLGNVVRFGSDGTVDIGLVPEPGDTTVYGVAFSKPDGHSLAGAERPTTPAVPPPPAPDDDLFVAAPSGIGAVGYRPGVEPTVEWAPSVAGPPARAPVVRSGRPASVSSLATQAAGRAATSGVLLALAALLWVRSGGSWRPRREAPV